MITTILTGCALGTLAKVTKEIYTMASDAYKENKRNQISQDTWEKLWRLNNIYIEHNNESITLPKLIDTKKLDNKEEYIFCLPLGVTTKDIEGCKIQIQELCNSEEINIEYTGNHVFKIEVLHIKKIKTFNGSIETRLWNKLWEEIDVYSGKNPDSRIYPNLISEKDIIGGKSYIFKMPIGTSSSNLKQEKVTITEFLDARYIEVESLKNNTVEIKAIFEELPTMIPFKLVPRSKKGGFEVVLGMCIDGFAKIDFTKMANVLCTGMIGSGKSIATKVALAYIGCMYALDEVEIYIADLKKSELTAFKRLKHVKKYVTTPKETDQMIKELVGIMNKRYDLFEKVGVSDIEEYNKKYPKAKLTYIFVAIEEMVRFTTAELYPPTRGKITQDQNTILSELLFFARASGMTVWCSVQRPTKDNLDTNIKSSLSSTLGFKTKDKANSLIVCDDEDGKLKDLRGRGNGYLMTEECDKEFQGFFIDNDEIIQLLSERNMLREKTQEEIEIEMQLEEYNKEQSFEREVALGLDNK